MIGEHQGSVTEVANINGGTVKSYKYDAFGNIKYQDGPTVNRGFTYTSRERHARSGLYYYRARWYSPALGRFLTPDPIGYLGGVNLYAYVHGDPVNFYDPYGLFLDSYMEMRVETGRMAEAVVQGAASSAFHFAVNDAVVPGPYGDPDLSHWGSWPSLPCEAGEFGEGYEYAEWGVLGLATAADLAAAGLMGAEIAGISNIGSAWRVEIKIDPAHHVFPLFGRVPHIRITQFIQGVKGSGRSFQIPFPPLP